MAGVKISALPAVLSAQLTDYFPVVQGGITSRETVQQLATLFNSVLSFLPLAGGTMAGIINMNSHKITNLTDPTSAQDAATKAYVDAVAAGLNPIPGCVAGTTGALTVTYNNGASGVGATLTNAGALAAFSIDGVSPTVGQRVLIKNQASTFQNGIYTVTVVGDGVTAWVLTRATDYDQPSEISPGDFVFVESGTVNVGSSWYESASVTSIGVDPIVFNAFFTPSSYAKSGANTDITSMSGLTGYLQAPLGIKDSNGNVIVGYSHVAASVNNWTFQNNATGANPVIIASGSDPTVAAEFHSKGGAYWFLDNNSTVGAELRWYNGAATQYTAFKKASAAGTTVTFTLPDADGSANFICKTNGSGVLSFANGSQVAGTATNDNASAGNIGELISSVVAQASAVALNAGAGTNITSISLTAGDWDVWGHVTLAAVSATPNTLLAWTSTTSATLPDGSLYSGTALTTNSLSAAHGANAPYQRYSLNATTTVYLSAYYASGAGGTGCGAIYARRAR